ncbi:subtilase-type protease inhibitor [Streptomyces sp. NPDC051219]|uniref:subtilase-type protease inhibitor n=1 Tax=Streptomyces sp. NPDC051219 TaxID=3155283 RepID=UPI0034431141
MRYLRNTLGATAATVTGLALLSTATAGIAHAEPIRPASLYAPSALVLTIAKGEKASTATIERAVTLSCAPTPSGTHPLPESACAELTAVVGNFTQLTAGPSNVRCTRIWDPVTVTSDGVWQGKRVRWSATYGNPCEMVGTMAGGTVFSF